jgi:hypothetical protein
MKNAKIKIVYYDVKDEIAIESIWALKVGEYYQLKNIPFFAPNIAYDDIIKVEEEKGELFFDEIIIPSGHSTIQIIFFDKSNIENIILEIEKMGCTWEGMDRQEILSVDVPKEVNYLMVKNFLDEKFNRNILDYKESCLAHDT